MSETVKTATATVARVVALKRTAAVVAGALAVALAAQVSVPLPGTPVPLTLQVPVALIVGGLLGPRLGATSLVLYLVMGAAGLPVFAPVGLPGAARLFGPTGGYLLALPLAAALTGLVARQPFAGPRCVIGLVLATAIVHAGGVAQLAALGGDLQTAWRLGSLPFLVGDAAKVLAAWAVLGRLGAPVHRALR
jgi:biotin transport system substrate-specific component